MSKVKTETYAVSVFTMCSKNYLMISIVSPVYDSETCLQKLVEKIIFNTKKLTNSIEIILVDDGSQDSTWNLIEIEAHAEVRVKGIKFSRNFGHHYAITAGIHKSVGEWVVVMDCDLQDRPEEIPRLYQKAQEGHEIVLALRGKRSDPMIKKLTSKIFYILLFL